MTSNETTYPVVVLNNGRVVLAKVYKGDLCALTYANRTQAQRMADRIGGDVLHFAYSGPFYVAPPLPRQEELELPDSCECDNTHEATNTVCRYCWARGRRAWSDPEVV